MLSSDMDGFARKRSSDGIGLSTRSSSKNIRDSMNEGKGIKNCNKKGCGTKTNSMKGINVDNPEKQKFLKASYRTNNSKFHTGSSSKTFTSTSEFRKSNKEKQVRTQSRDTAESSSRRRLAEDLKLSDQQKEPEDSEVIPTIRTIQTVLQESESRDLPNLHGSSKLQTKKTTSRPQKQMHLRLGSSSDDSSGSSSSNCRSVASKHTGHVSKACSYLGSGLPKYGLNNLSGPSIPSVFSAGCSSSNLGNCRKITSVRYKSSDGESSSSSGGKSTEGLSATNSSSSSSGVLMPQSVRRTITCPIIKDSPVSVRTRRAVDGDGRMRLPEQHNEDGVSIVEPIICPQLSHSQLSILESVPESSSRSFPLETPPVFHNSFGGRPSSGGRNARSRLLSSHPAESSRHQISRDRDEYRHFNTEGIAEVLLALERIEQNDELTYEHLMVLQTNLLLAGFSFRDQHREMRLDIDNMTYEELLALEDTMGTVSTALPEETLSKCLKRSIYVPIPRLPAITVCEDDETKCSICQEEYIAGEEIGKLACDHGYHVDCISQWLRQKNWCPICKTSAASPSQEINS